MKYSEDERVKEATLKALLSGAASGGVFGAATSALSSKNPLKLLPILKSAALGATTAGGIAGGSTYLGSKLAGVPSEEETSGYTKRASLGGAVGGGAIGAVAGALASRGKLPLPKVTPRFISKYFDDLASRGAKESIPRGVLIGALAGGVPAAFYAGDEGMQIDFLNNEIKEARKKKMLQELGVV